MCDDGVESLDCDRRDRGDRVDSNEGRNRSFPLDEEPAPFEEVLEKTLPSSDTSTFAWRASIESKVVLKCPLPSGFEAGRGGLL